MRVEGQRESRAELKEEIAAMAKTLASQGYRSLNIEKNPQHLIGFGLEATIAFYGSGAGWFGKHSRAHLTHERADRRGNDIEFSLRLGKSGREFIVVADATSAVKSLEEKMTRRPTGTIEFGRGQVGLLQLEPHLPDPLSEIYKHPQARTETKRVTKKGPEKVLRAHDVPRVVIGVTGETLLKVLHEKKASLRHFETNPVQLRLLEQMFVQVTYIRDSIDKPQNAREEEKYKILDLTRRMLANIYLRRWHVVPEERREMYSDDPVHVAALEAAVMPEVKQLSREEWPDVLAELREYVAMTPRPKEEDEPWPVAVKNETLR